MDLRLIARYDSSSDVYLLITEILYQGYFVILITDLLKLASIQNIFYIFFISFYEESYDVRSYICFRNTRYIKINY